MFRMLKLNPPNGWRAVAWELGIVTAGVLIALGAQQWADERSWRARGDEAMEALSQENKANFKFAAEFVAVAPCVGAQLDALAERIERADPRLDPAPAIDSTLGKVAYRRPSRPYRSIVWDSLVADGVAARLPAEQRQKVAGAYSGIAMLKQLSDLSAEAINRTSILLRPLELNPATKLPLLQDIAAERTRVSGTQRVAAQTLIMLGDAGLAPSDASIVAEIKNSGTTEYCRAARLPLADWRAERDSAPPMASTMR